MRISPIIHRSRDEAEEQALKRDAVHGARTETPAHRLNLLQFVAYRHSLLSVVFRRSHTRFGASVRERVFHLAFATACALYVAMQADIWTSAHADASILAGASTFIALSLTVLLVTPLTLIVRCTYVPLGDWLNDRLPCVEELTRGWMRVEEALLLIFIFRVAAFGLFDPLAAEAKAGVVGVYAVFAQFGAEVPALLVQWVVLACCCGCCMAREDDFGVASRQSPKSPELV